MRGDLIEVYKRMKGYNKGDINKVLIVKNRVGCVVMGLSYINLDSAKT